MMGGGLGPLFEQRSAARSAGGKAADAFPPAPPPPDAIRALATPIAKDDMSGTEPQQSNGKA